MVAEGVEGIESDEGAERTRKAEGEKRTVPCSWIMDRPAVLAGAVRDVALYAVSQCARRISSGAGSPLSLVA